MEDIPFYHFGFNLLSKIVEEKFYNVNEGFGFLKAVYISLILRNFSLVKNCLFSSVTRSSQINFPCPKYAPKT